MTDTVHPTWWHRSGRWVRNTEKINRHEIAFTSGSRHVKIRRVIPRRGHPHYEVRWLLFRGGEEWLSGSIRMDAIELATAFDTERTESVGEKSGFAQCFEATHAVQGLFIRFGDHLNIPMPGTGKDEDPNISILLTEAIRKRVAWFMSTYPTS